MSASITSAASSVRGRVAFLSPRDVSFASFQTLLWVRALVVSVAVAFVTVLGGFGLAHAHDQVVASKPADQAVIEALPREISITFSGTPRSGFNTIAVSKDGEVLVSGEPRAQGKRLTLPIPKSVSSDPGEYTVGFQITSSDGHATRGSYRFTVDPNAQAQAGGKASANGQGAGPENGSAPAASKTFDQRAQEWSSWLLPLSGIVVVSGALVLAINRFRSTRD